MLIHPLLGTEGFIRRHPGVVILLVLGYWVFNNAVSALPAPEDGGKGYKFTYALLHGLSGSLLRRGQQIMAFRKGEPEKK